MELDEVIDQMIAERVIHRHRRKWIVFFVLLVVGILLVWLLNGWDEPDQTDIKTVQAPYTFDAGRFEYAIDRATLVKTPKKDKYSEAKAQMVIRMGIKNIDTETKTSESIQGSLFYLAQKEGKPLTANGATCNGELNQKLVYGLPLQECTISFDVPATYSETKVLMGIVAEEFRSDSGIGVTDEPYWHEGKLELLVEMTAKEETAK